MTYIIPFLFAYNPALLLIPEYWDIWQVLRLVFFYIPGLILFAAGLSGFWAKRMQWYDTVVALAGGVMMLFPIFAVQFVGLVVFIYIFIRQDIYSMYLRKKPAAA